METPTNVLITGGSQGIGLGLARRYLAAEARVLVTGRSQESLAEAAAQLPGLETVVSDIGSTAARAALAGHVAQVMPDVDLVINNAGIQRRVALAAECAEWDERAQEMAILFDGPVHLNHLLIPTMFAHRRPSRIVNVTSGGAFIPQPFAPIYSAAKAALHSYTMNLRFALDATPIRVIELIPPAVATTLSGLENPHGAPVDDFVDSAFAGIARNEPEIGYGPTNSDEFRARLRAENDAFAASANRLPQATYPSEAHRCWRVAVRVGVVRQGEADCTTRGQPH